MFMMRAGTVDVKLLPGEEDMATWNYVSGWIYAKGCGFLRQRIWEEVERFSK